MNHYEQTRAQADMDRSQANMNRAMTQYSILVLLWLVLLPITIPLRLIIWVVRVLFVSAEG